MYKSQVKVSGILHKTMRNYTTNRKQTHTRSGVVRTRVRIRVICIYCGDTRIYIHRGGIALERHRDSCVIHKSYSVCVSLTYIASGY